MKEDVLGLYLFLLNTDERRCPGSIPPIENYYELTIPRYSDDFKMHFRLTRETFEATCLRLSRHDAFNRQKGPAPYIEKATYVLMTYRQL